MGQGAVVAAVAMVTFSLQGCDTAKAKAHLQGVYSSASQAVGQAYNDSAGLRAQAAAYAANATAAAHAKYNSPEVQAQIASLQAQAGTAAAQAQQQAQLAYQQAQAKAQQYQPQMQQGLTAAQQQAQVAYQQAQAKAQQYQPQLQQGLTQAQSAVQNGLTQAQAQAQPYLQQATPAPGAVYVNPAQQFEVFGADGSDIAHSVGSNSGSFVAVSAVFFLGTGALALALRRARAPAATDEASLIEEGEGLE